MPITVDVDVSRGRRTEPRARFLAGEPEAASSEQREVSPARGGAAGHDVHCPIL